ncbi:MAG: pilus assembly PilX N-terminal domain-containing protein [Deltaproteobacteria bacterium]|nr:pilus assembly PilX N-terminal domain-containing protein [Deltaproteobacteria bacterium]MBZ0221233.1 pilus assembly PilX N-terminal domain-containing protein [Deltaproteobacteria bacterium]
MMEAKKITGNERGMALVIALIALFLMSILGGMVFTTSNSEVLGAKNHRVMNESLYAAERGIEYAKSDPAIYSAIGTGSVAIPIGGVSLETVASDASGIVEYLTRGNPPRGSGMDATEFEANYFAVNVEGTGPLNSRTEVEINVARIVPKN